MYLVKLSTAMLIEPVAVTTDVFVRDGAVYEMRELPVETGRVNHA